VVHRCPKVLAKFAPNSSIHQPVVCTIDCKSWLMYLSHYCSSKNVHIPWLSNKYFTFSLLINVNSIYVQQLCSNDLNLWSAPTPDRNSWGR